MSNHTNQLTQQEQIEKLGKLIKKIDFGMFTTLDNDGNLRSRPMSTQQVELDGTLWFFSGLDTAKVQEIMRQPQVNLSYSNPGDNEFVSVSGGAEVINDHDKMAKLWNPILKAWFPDGLGDPNLRLIKVNVEKAEYWDSPNSTVVQLLGFAKALVTGKPYEGGENEKLDLK